MLKIICPINRLFFKLESLKSEVQINFEFQLICELYLIIRLKIILNDFLELFIDFQILILILIKNILVFFKLKSNVSQLYQNFFGLLLNNNLLTNLLKLLNNFFLKYLILINLWVLCLIIIYSSLKIAFNLLRIKSKTKLIYIIL